MHKLIVMGVSGCGKSTLAAGIALSLGCRLIEGDELHLPESQAKMRQGKALQDSDREPWLDRAQAIDWLALAATSPTNEASHA